MLVALSPLLCLSISLPLFISRLHSFSYRNTKKENEDMKIKEERRKSVKPARQAKKTFGQSSSFLTPAGADDVKMAFGEDGGGKNPAWGGAAGGHDEKEDEAVVPAGDLHDIL